MSDPLPTPTPAAPDRPSPARRPLPWRSAAVGWVVLAAILAAGLPLFLRMPVWIDVTLYDLAARAVLSGGTHYRDVFDTNPPGFVWSLCVIRTVLGPSMEALRAVDLVVVGAVVALLVRWARAGGATAAGAVWTAAGAATFYLFLSEFNHCQRDVWMMLPVTAAVLYRLRRVGRGVAGPTSPGWVFRTAIVEGLVWGLAAWVKPHVVVIAAAAWAVTQGRLAGPGRPGIGGKLVRSAADLAGSVAGGLIVGGVGLAWLVGSGTWPYMVDVFTEWNTSYLSAVLSEFAGRLDYQLGYFPPWSVLIVAAVPLAVLNLLDFQVWSEGGPGPIIRRLPGWLYDQPGGGERRFARGVVAAVYLSWVAMALVLQKQYHYVHVPETLLMLALFAANRWAVVVPVAAVQLGVMLWAAATPDSLPRWDDQPVVYRHLVWHYPDRGPDRFRYWPACFARDVSGDVRNGVAFQTDDHSGVNWSELEEVAEFLRSQGVVPGDTRVMCWHDSPHPLYLMMDLRPPIRFMHLSTATGMGAKAEERVKEEVTAAAPGVRFVVSDLTRVALFFPPDVQARMKEPGLLPPAVPRECRSVFPMNQPAVFRSGGGRGRYVVHVLTRPVGEVYIPGWPGPD